MFVTHDLSVVKHISDNICVMYLGQLVETTTSKELFDRPLHPYTKALLSAIPSIDIHHQSQRIILKEKSFLPLNRNQDAVLQQDVSMLQKNAISRRNFVRFQKTILYHAVGWKRLIRNCLVPLQLQAKIHPKSPLAMAFW